MLLSFLLTIVMILSFNIAVIGAYILILTSALSGVAKITISAFLTSILSVIVLSINEKIESNKNKDKNN